MDAEMTVVSCNQQWVDAENSALRSYVLRSTYLTLTSLRAFGSFVLNLPGTGVRSIRSVNSWDDFHGGEKGGGGEGGPLWKKGYGS